MCILASSCPEWQVSRPRGQGNRGRRSDVAKRSRATKKGEAAPKSGASSIQEVVAHESRFEPNVRPSVGCDRRGPDRAFDLAKRVPKLGHLDELIGGRLQEKQVPPPCRKRKARSSLRPRQIDLLHDPGAVGVDIEERVTVLLVAEAALVEEEGVSSAVGRGKIVRGGVDVPVDLRAAFQLLGQGPARASAPVVPSPRIRHWRSTGRASGGCIL